MTTLVIGVEVETVMTSTSGKAYDNLTAFIDDVIKTVNAVGLGPDVEINNRTSPSAVTPSATRWWLDEAISVEIEDEEDREDLDCKLESYFDFLSFLTTS